MIFLSGKNIDSTNSQFNVHWVFGERRQHHGFCFWKKCFYNFLLLENFFLISHYNISFIRLLCSQLLCIIFHFDRQNIFVNLSCKFSTWPLEPNFSITVPVHGIHFDRSVLFNFVTLFFSFHFFFHFFIPYINLPIFLLYTVYKVLR